MDRILREKDTITKMIAIYCKDHHPKSKSICADCFELKQYSFKRIENCQYGKNKPVCRKCETHCYKDFYRDKVRQMMRYSGPRMLKKHPILTIQHFFDAWRYK